MDKSSFPSADGASQGKNNRRNKLRTDDGRPNPNSKLTDTLEEKLCALIQNQLTLADACDLVEVNRKTVWEWRNLFRYHEPGPKKPLRSKAEM